MEGFCRNFVATREPYFLATRNTKIIEINWETGEIATLYDAGVKITSLIALEDE
jgi:hypothetical protein